MHSSWLGLWEMGQEHEGDLQEVRRGRGIEAATGALFMVEVYYCEGGRGRWKEGVWLGKGG